MRQPFLLVFFFFTTCLRQSAMGQAADADSLRKVIARTQDPHQKLSSLFALCANRKSLPSDSLERYVLMARELSRTIGSQTDQQWADFYFSSMLVGKGYTDSAVSVINDLMERLGSSGPERSLYIRSSFLRTNAFVRKNRYREALKGYYSILSEAQNSHDTMSIIMARNGLGWVHMEMGQFRNAISWLRSSLNMRRDTVFYQKYNFIYADLASTYNSLSMPDSAEYFAIKSIEGSKKFDDLEGLANGLNILADTYINTNRSAAAEPLLRQVIVTRKRIGDPYYIVSDMMQLAKFYASHHEPDKGIALSLEGIAMARKLDLSSKLPVLYESLAKNYEEKGDYKKYAQTLEDLIAVKDSVYKINSVDVASELNIRYELQRNENTIIKQKLDIVEKSYWLNAYILFSALTVLTAIVIFREYRRKNKRRLQSLVENERQNRLKAIMEAEENQRRRISGDLHDSLGVQANAILYGTELLQHEHLYNPMLVNDLHDSAKDMLVTLRETLWAMKIKEATAAEVWLRVINFSKQLGRYYPSVNISTTGVVPAGFHFSAAKSLNVVLILQEALNNSVRHSGAKNISVTSRDEDDAWTVTVEDDGKGFDPEEAGQKKESYGLVNMKSRAESADIHLSILTGVNKGVKTLLSISHPQ